MRVSELKYSTIYRFTWEGQYRPLLIDRKVGRGIEVTFLDTDEEDFILTCDAEKYVVENPKTDRK
jgi:hypothetical protein